MSKIVRLSHSSKMARTTWSLSSEAPVTQPSLSIQRFRWKKMQAGLPGHDEVCHKSCPRPRCLALWLLVQLRCCSGSGSKMSMEEELRLAQAAGGCDPSHSHTEQRCELGGERGKQSLFSWNEPLDCCSAKVPQDCKILSCRVLANAVLNSARRIGCLKKWLQSHAWQ